MKSHVLGFPRIGAQRELKKALESYWKKEISSEELICKSDEIKNINWETQKSAGLTYAATGDFSFYDHILDTSAMLGLVPSRYGFTGKEVDLDTYFHMARGNNEKNIAAMEMKKWFNTNYHYIVPEFEEGMEPFFGSKKIINETKAAKEKGFNPKPVLVGPFTYLLLGNEIGNARRFDLLDKIVDIYCTIISELSKYSDLIQIDEPILSTDLENDISKEFKSVYEKIKKASNGAKIFISSYFAELRDNFDILVNSGVDGIHIDLINSKAEIDSILEKLPVNMFLSAGIVNGRNIWINDLETSIETLKSLQAKTDSEILAASSCSILHSPVDLDNETEIEEKIKSWLSFANQKVKEVAFLGNALSGNIDEEFLNENKKAVLSRKESHRLNVEDVRKRASSLTEDMYKRNSPFEKRIKIQNEKIDLPLFPVTTIGSFPQTKEIRKTRLQFKRGEISYEEYEKFMKAEIESVVRFQEKLDIDVLVHGEPERNDMVEYFGENLEGFCFTKNGWVQSYGSRCVKPPVIYGDVFRKDPMTLKWINYANSITDKDVKGMLTGPVTILCWSFVRDDISRSAVCRQIALAIRDEVKDLEKAGTKIIQIDEAALREGLPLRKSDYEEYLTWAIDSFLISSTGVEDSTQIHTHMCYSEFNSIIEWIAKMDADVISIESSRSKMTLLDAFDKFNYPNEIGPGVYDIHSPRVPEVEEISDLLKKALDVIPVEKLWVNPDCGLKTRAWPETEKSLENLVEAAKLLRKEFS